MLKDFWAKYRKNTLAVIGLLFIGLCTVIAILGYWVTPDSSYACNTQHVEMGRKPPGYVATIVQGSSDRESVFTTLLHGHAATQELFLYGSDGDTAYSNLIHNQTNATIDTKRFVLGSDIFGRDVLSRVLLGTRVSLSVGFISVLISLVLGVSLGLAAGYYKGRVDDVVMWLINVIWSLPTLLLVVAITFAMGKGFWQIFVAVGLTMWVELARVVRGQVFSLREMEYVQAAKMLGFSNIRIMFKHILPNCIGPIVVICAANFASAILLEAGLSFLGLGIQPPFPSWGQMLSENADYIALGSPHLALAPGVAIMLLVMSFNFVGNGLRDAFDVKL